ncbi:YdeI/OmpD-associated family protein [Archangium lansingense]|uniref:YdeI/OmpD-associated family protein n=1 Tax=Archangium lansingense TaxID=2995310 RepID=A0ABT3ZWL6_9BACT|nr:YdeI/OmpD-associated family protein [Archangium lansinium]MCY1073491.1 YdeI/OmpD-associated family protein [Archangium lansinium]
MASDSLCSGGRFPDTRGPAAGLFRALGSRGTEKKPLPRVRLLGQHQKEYADHVREAKRPETRHSRASKSVAMLTEGKRLKG